MHNALVIDINKLNILLCHKINYEDFIIGTYLIENNQITSCIAKTPSLAIIKAHLKRSCTPHCEYCNYLNICEGFCYGLSYEKSYNPLIPIKQNCDLIKCKYNFLLYKYKLLDIFNKNL